MDLREVGSMSDQRASLILTRRVMISSVQFKVCHGSLYAVMWLADEPREFNLPTLPQRHITHVPEKLPSKYGVHSEECYQVVDPVRVTYKSIQPLITPYTLVTLGLYFERGTRLRVFENKALRTIFGGKKDEVTGEWRKLHNTELHALYSSTGIIRNIKSRRLRWAGHVARMGESRNAYRVLDGKPEVKDLWEGRDVDGRIILMDLREVGCHHRDWINLAQDRDRRRAYVRAAMNLWVP
ncbi:hypothetical protein ANN_09210 [Periplaneta americana]|uniref:Uncharacterized protein n=1 Tax=Periplaneta americana TaxID=6978 RepID=A0ABQ8TKR3_PERAM|nr:hypothetical protein ANN_09210 [Periplaneta americana]